MDRAGTLAAARADLAEQGESVAALLRARPHLDLPLGGGSTWTVRDAGAHLSLLAVYADLAAGAPSPVTTLDRDAVAVLQRQSLDDIGENDPAKVADLVAGAVSHYLAATAGWSADHPVSYHLGARIDLTDLTLLAVEEVVLHGYDIAAALGVAWPIAPGTAARVLGTLLPLMALMPDPDAVRGHTAAYGIEVRGHQGLTVRFADGAFGVEPPCADVQAVVSADPVALWLVMTGRLPVWSAVALGLYEGRGARPDLAYGFPALFRFC